ncbi:MAG TPA: tetratricopeptide repeat protein [Candidatus Acidoferrum sp.]|nr:tetratricopeptide repeat protein [Candidatus Acidoferrum sp.]
MTATTTQPGSHQWSSAQTFVSALLSLLLGIGGGYLIRKSRMPAVPGMTAATAPSFATPPPITLTPPSVEQVKGTVDVQAAVKLEQLKADPNDAALLTELGNIYYDNKQFRTAIEYYNRVLKIRPADTSVRTDMATAYWFSGDPDTAIAEFNKSLSYEPTKANALFNLGIVKWQGKHDGPGAIAVWQKLLVTNPNYDEKEKVIQLIAQAKAQVPR